jgi:hypothetical protein
MSRRIVQIVANGYTLGVGENVVMIEQLFALDNNGIAWVLERVVDANHTGSTTEWKRLPALPSIDTRPPRPPIAQYAEELDA